MKKVIIAVVLIAVVVLAVVKLNSNQHTVQAKVYRPDEHKKVLVKAQAVENKSLDKTFVYTGTFLPFKEIMLVPQAQGEVTHVFFAEGDIVSKGKLLMKLDDELLQAQSIAAQASYESAKRNFERYEKASQSEGVSKIQYDNYWLQLKNAESQLKQLQKNIALHSLIAPFAGIITMKDVEVGTSLGTSPVGRLTDVSQLKLEVAVPENEVVLFEENDMVEISTSVFPGKTFSGRIDYVANRSDDSHNYTVKILVKNTSGADLKAGMYGTASLKKGLHATALIIPRAALLGSAKEPKVFVVENNKAILKAIEIGRSNSLEVEVLGGLSAGQQIVYSGQINLTNGSNVTLAN